MDIGEFIRIDKLEYQIEALREAVLNALVHRDYEATCGGEERKQRGQWRVEEIGATKGPYPKVLHGWSLARLFGKGY